MTEAREQRQMSLIEKTPPHAGPSALSLIQSVDQELERLNALEAMIGRSTSFTRYQREQLLRRREEVAKMVN